MANNSKAKDGEANNSEGPFYDKETDAKTDAYMLTEIEQRVAKSNAIVA